MVLNFVLVLQSNGIQIEDFHFDYRQKGNRIVFVVEAPTKGWVLIGFNQKSDIVGSYLVFGTVKDKASIYLDKYVRGFADPVSVSGLGEESDLQMLRLQESEGSTYFTFSLPIKSQCAHCPSFPVGSRQYIWLAYSVSDDFDHHSRKRIGRWITLNY
jgi:hypothetical protein